MTLIRVAPSLQSRLLPCYGVDMPIAPDMAKRQSLPRTRYGVLARWTTRIGLGERPVTTKTLRRRFFSLAGRIIRKARRLTLHLPQDQPRGKPVQCRSRPIACPATPFLTAGAGTGAGRPPDYLAASQIRVGLVPECLLLQAGCRSRPPPALRAVRHHLRVAVAPRTRPNLSGSKPCSLIPAPLIPSVDSGLRRAADGTVFLRRKPTIKPPT